MAPVMHCCTACAENSSPERGHSPNSPSDGKTLRFTGSAAVFLDSLTGLYEEKAVLCRPAVFNNPALSARIFCFELSWQNVSQGFPDGLL